MLEFNNLDAKLKQFGKIVITQSRANLTRGKNNATKKLYRSLSYSSRASSNSFEFEIEMEDYGMYQDRGVSGKRVKYDTPYAFKKMPPSKVFQQWAKVKGIKPRDKKTGRFMSFETFGFLVARKKFEEGLKPLRFFSRPFERHYPKIEKEMAEYFAVDLEEFLKFTTKNIFK